jgi:redox-regulated HSP33 family molecular chaperone
MREATATSLLEPALQRADQLCLTVDGDIAARDCLVRFERNGQVLAVASMYRDVEDLQAELAMERME